MTADKSPDKFIGLVLDDKYEIESLIGVGGTGNVYKGKHRLIGDPIAIKILHPSLSYDETAQKRFRQEARLTMSIRHPNALGMMDFGIIEDKIFYIVMEYISGSSLYQLIKTERKIAIPRAVEFMKQICLAIDEAHKLNILHRDLKPDNVMIIDCGLPTESVKVIDFSIAKRVGGDNLTQLTAAGQVLGTPQYLSPEQAQGLPLTPGCDIYSLSIILYEMLTGTLPFVSKTSTGYLMKHVHNPPRPPRNINPEIPPRLESVILQALAKEPTQRPATAAEFAALIEEAAKSGGEDEPLLDDVADYSYSSLSPDLSPPRPPTGPSKPVTGSAKPVTGSTTGSTKATTGSTKSVNEPAPARELPPARAGSGGETATAPAGGGSATRGEAGLFSQAAKDALWLNRSLRSAARELILLTG